MKILAISFLATAAALTGFGEDEGTDSEHLLKVGDRSITRVELQEKIHKVQQKRHGGIIRAANSAKGVFVVLNAQRVVPLAEISSLEPMLDKWLRIQMEFKDTDDTIDSATVRSAIARAGGKVGVAVVDAADGPMLTVAPEDGWALVNVSRMKADQPSAEQLASRVRKEVLRGLAFVTGGAYLSKADPLMRDVKTAGDLDGLQAEQFGLEVVAHLLESSGFYGLKPWRQATYRKACQEGWAPQPTNEFQKAIWDEVHAIPQNPMKIEFDPKKGR